MIGKILCKLGSHSWRKLLTNGVVTIGQKPKYITILKCKYCRKLK